MCSGEKKTEAFLSRLFRFPSTFLLVHLEENLRDVCFVGYNRNRFRHWAFLLFLESLILLSSFRLFSRENEK